MVKLARLPNEEVHDEVPRRGSGPGFFPILSYPLEPLPEVLKDIRLRDFNEEDFLKAAVLRTIALRGNPGYVSRSPYCSETEEHWNELMRKPSEDIVSSVYTVTPDMHVSLAVPLFSLDIYTSMGERGGPKLKGERIKEEDVLRSVRAADDISMILMSDWIKTGLVWIKPADSPKEEHGVIQGDFFVTSGVMKDYKGGDGRRAYYVRRAEGLDDHARERLSGLLEPIEVR
jgi:hypothetical protein